MKSASDVKTFCDVCKNNVSGLKQLISNKAKKDKRNHNREDVGFKLCEDSFHCYILTLTAFTSYLTEFGWYNTYMGKTESVKAWLISAEDNVSVAEDMFRLNHLNWSLFMWGLAIEKTLKAYLLFNDIEVPYTHDLHKLYLLTNLKVSEDLVNDLKEITTFNINARYEETKYDLYKKATKEYTDIYVSKSKSIYIWIKDNLKV